MIELPYFKFFPNQWLTGSISFLDYDQQGAFMKLCCYYWSKECKVSFSHYKAIIPDHYQALIDFGIVKQKDSFIKINWLDEQLAERKTAHEKRVIAGRKGGKQSSSNAQALKEDNKRKEPYMNTSSISKLVKENKNDYK